MGMKKQINLLAGKHLLKNQVVKFPDDKKSTPNKPVNETSGQILTWPAPDNSNNAENLNMYTPSPDTSLHILANSPMGVVITDDAGLVLWCNKTLVKWAGKKTGECIGRSEAGMLNSANPAATSISNGPHKLSPDSNGKERLIMRCPIPINGDKKAIFYVDVTDEEQLRRERTQLAKQLEQHNTVEPISGLLNQQGISMGLEPLISRSRRYENPLSLVTMSVTNLDNIQKSTGQVGADKMILAISQLLRDQLRWADLVGRMDTGDFIFVLPETDQSAAIALANKIAGKFTDLNIPVDDQQSNKPEACFGVASWSKGDDSAQLLARTASAANTASQNGAFAVEAA
jgi:diguanylate cyclase (GGDEF)-like protein